MKVVCGAWSVGIVWGLEWAWPIVEGGRSAG